WATNAVPNVPAHDLDVPRIGYVHAWQRTQDEGWVRAAFDTYGVPYTYFADQKLKDGNLRQRFDVIVLPHIGGTATSQISGVPVVPGQPALPYRKTDATPNLGVLDQSDDIRGGMGLEGLAELQKFVAAGGTLIVEGATATVLPAFGLTPGVVVEEPPTLFARGSVMRGIIADTKSPIVYGYEGKQLPIYFNQAPVLAVSSGAPQGFGGGGAATGPSQNITPMATRVPLSPWEQDSTTAAGRRTERPGDAEGGQGPQPGAVPDSLRPRVVMQFPARAEDILLSGTLQNGQLLANRAQIVDARLGSGHVVMFAIRPFWRWQTQGSYFLGFNTILNWNDLDAGRARPAPAAVTAAGDR
ncbi:MAG TPA: hypothetical protein VHM67_11570, partial [Gemmatimonadaceae bacterium]|nr:hypothetical protein [Gemmatimonadaceae bacterium]